MQQVLAEKMLSRTSAKQSALADLSLIILGSLVVAAAAQLSIHLELVPITAQTLGVLLVGMGLGPRRGALAMVAYLAEGVAGLPVFAEGKVGLAALQGPTGGYLLGFIAAAWLVGLLAERGFDRNLFATLAAMVAGNLVIYACGLIWLQPFLGGDWQATVNAGMYPFLLGDAIKAVLAALLLPTAWKLLGTGKFK
ncbi:MAG: biotin transporter BioY [Anaerolineales bacterium]